MKLWIVGQWDESGWGLQGVFDSEQKAAEYAKEFGYFVGPAELNKKLPHKQQEWAGCYYPHEVES